MVPRKKLNKFWKYFEELKPTLVKCTTCKKEIKTPHPTCRIRIFRVHLLKVHGMSLDNDTLTLSDDLKQYYSELPGYKGKCNNCGKTISFLTSVGNLRQHLRRHSITIQSSDEADMVPRKKRSELWNYFEELKPTLVKCTTCKKEIKIAHPTTRTEIMRIHLSKHGIFLDNDTLSLPDDLKQYYSELPGYKAKCNDCGKAVSFLTNIVCLRKHLRRHSTSIQGRDETVMVPRKKRSKLWNYYEELNPSLVKCTICKKEIPLPRKPTKIMRIHLSKHGVFLDNDTHTLPDNLRQCYSELPGYKAKCNNCGETISFLTSVANLRQHLRRHSTIILSRDETSVMVPRKKRSKLWNYFEELKPTLVKCTTCKKEIKISRPTRHTKMMRIHLSKHGIFLDNDTLSLPDDLKQCYSELPGYKAKCKDCGKTLSFLRNVVRLREHLRRHSTITQGRDEMVRITSRRKRSKFWKYFEELKPTLIKCTTCKKEIKISHPSNRIQIFRAHLLNVHGIFLDNDTHTLPDDLKQHYSKLPAYKAKCNNCGKTLSFLNVGNLRVHLRRHSPRILSRDEADMVPRKKRNKLWNYFEELKPTLVKCTTCKKKIKISHPKYHITIFRAHLKRHGIFLDNDIRTLPDDLKQYYSELTGYKAKCNECGKTLSFLRNVGFLRTHLRRHSTRIESQDEPSTSKLADNSVDPSADCQSQDTSDLPIQSLKEAIEKTGALDKSSTLSSTAYIMDPSTGKYIPLRQSQKQVPPGLHVQSFKETAENTGVLDE